MASYSPPTYSNLTVFVPQYWETTSDSNVSSYLSLSEANALYLKLSGNETVSGMVDFTGGISTNYISPIAINDDLVLDDYGNIYLTTNTSNVCISSNANILSISNPINATGYYLNNSLIFPTIDSNVSGYVLSNDGTATEWSNISGQLVPTISSSTSGQYLTNDGNTSSWANVGEGLTIGGSSGQIQYNNSGNLDGSANLTISNNKFTAYTLSANATTVGIDSFLQFTGGFVNLGNYPVNITPYNGQVGYSGTNTISLYYSGFIVIECWNSDGSHWNCSYGMVYDSKAPLLNTSGSNPTISAGYSNGNPYISFTNSSSSTYVYYSIWIFGDGINSYS